MEEVHRLLVEEKGEGEAGRGLPAAAQGRLGPGKGELSYCSPSLHSALADLSLARRGLGHRTRFSLGYDRAIHRSPRFAVEVQRCEDRGLHFRIALDPFRQVVG